MRYITTLILGIIFLTSCSGQKAWFVSQIKVEDPDYLKGYVNAVNLNECAWANVNNKPEIRKLGVRFVNVVISDDILYGLTKKGGLFCYDIQKKQIIWQMPLSIKITSNSSMQVNSGRLFITDGQNQVAVIDARDGQQIWYKAFSNFVFNKPYVDGDVIYIQMASGDFIAIDYASGKIIWEISNSSDSVIMQSSYSPAVYKDNIIMSTVDGNIHSLNKISGKKSWSAKLSQEYVMQDIYPMNIIQPPIIEKNNGYFLNNYMVVKINLDNGAIIWKKKIPNLEVFKEYGPIIIVATSSGQVAGISKTKGEVVWATQLPLKLFQADFLEPIIVCNQLNLTDRLSGNMFRMNVLNGGVIGSYKFKATPLIYSAYDPYYFVNSSELYIFK